MVTQKQKFGPNRQINENKSRQKALIAAGHKELKVDGSWGPYQDKLWKDYKKKHPEAVNAVLDIAPAVNYQVGGADFEGERARHSSLNSMSREPENFTSSTINQQLNNKYYKMAQDTIAKREINGFYKRDPEMKARDRKMADQYKNAGSKEPGWSCINSVTGLYNGKIPTIPGNATFADRAQKLGFKQTKTPKPFSIIQEWGSTMPVHAVYNLGGNTVYNTHGFVMPFKNGNQIESSSYNEKFDGNQNSVNFYNPENNIFWEK